MTRKSDRIQRDVKGPWEWFRCAESPPMPIAGKYLFFSPDREELVKLALSELRTGTFYRAKISLIDADAEFVLCLYAATGARKRELADKYRGHPNVKYRSWKSDEDTLAGKYSNAFLSQLAPPMREIFTGRRPRNADPRFTTATRRSIDVTASIPLVTATDAESVAGVLHHTFIHVAGVGPATERRLWAVGVRSLQEFVDAHRSRTTPIPSAKRLVPTIEESLAALQQRNLAYFSERLPSRERWRLLGDFWDRTALLDIETTGLNPDFHEITVIGLYVNRRFTAFVSGKNLDDFPSAVPSDHVLVTFNGSKFDLPFIRARFRQFAPTAHVDLRYPLRKLGFTGGLKRIEHTVGLQRPCHIRDVDGFEAVRLWNSFRLGNKKALTTLIEYCQADVENLRPIASLVANRMRAELGIQPI